MTKSNPDKVEQLYKNILTSFEGSRSIDAVEAMMAAIAFLVVQVSSGPVDEEKAKQVYQELDHVVRRHTGDFQ